MWTVKLLKADHVPSDFREPFIINGYRSCRCTVSTCLFSALQYTNETMNFWTHFAGFLFFLWQMYQTGDRYWKYDDPFTWAFIAYLISCCIYLVTSSWAHLFSCMSEWFRHVCFFMDYGALSVYSFGCALAYNYYVFPTDYLGTWAHKLFVPLAFVNGLCCTMLACSSRLMHEGKLRKIFRMVAFMLPYVCCSVPLLYRMVFCQGMECEAESFVAHKWQFYFAFITSFLYASHFPEVLAPGKFDFIGHSHQIFHVCGCLATYSQFLAVVSDMCTRRELLLAHAPSGTFMSTLGLLGLLVVSNLLIIASFANYIWSPEQLRKIKFMQGKKTIISFDEKKSV
ncbi:Membrane progestin receptor gamma-A [Holothuria leucospilota]|uniref:Membrane progestin receptor gamma-A n=1 Tax=Holothuria leucospilota TaxID=206669 RepID=A0A9Q1CNV8_HOLLE|nr:Membrane progestin receptor gamma-A [Holothuria leucospilota]